MAINIVALFGIVKIQLNTDFASFSPDESIYKDRLEETEEMFGELNQLVVVIETNDITSDVLGDMSSVQRELEGVDDISFVQGAAPEELIINGVPTDYDSLSSESILNYYQSFGDFSPLKIEENVNYFVYTLFISEDFTKNSIEDIESILDDVSYESYISGDSYNQLKVTDYIFRILLILPPITILIILAVFQWQMGAFKPTMFSVLPAAIGSLWTFGLIGWLGNEVSILTAVVPIFIIVIGSADGLHFMSHYQDSKSEGLDNKESLISTLKLVGIPMIVTTLTSMAGFLSLLSISTSSIRDLSIYSSVGILLAGVATWYVLPMILSHDIDVSRKKVRSNRVDIAKGIRKLVGIPSLIIVVVIVVIASIFQSDINNEFNMLMVYKDSTIVNQNAEKVNEVNGGSIPIYVSVELLSDVLSVDGIDEISSLTEALNELDEVNKVVNPYELVSIVFNNTLANDGNPDTTLPIANDMILSGIYTQLSSDPNNTVHNLISESDNVVRLLVFPKDLSNETLENIENRVDDLEMNTKVTGVQYLMKDLNDSISRMQFESILLALGVVLIMLVITLKSFRVAIYSLIPIVLTVISLYGFLGLSQIPLNITTVIIFSITIGVGIDYAVHFSSVYKYYLKETRNNKLAIDKAFNNSSRPIIANAIGISLGLSSLVFSPLTIHFNVSMLMWVSMIVSVLLTLTLLPFIFGLRKDDKHA
jgi:hypothetical protein